VPLLCGPSLQRLRILLARRMLLPTVAMEEAIESELTDVASEPNSGEALRSVHVAAVRPLDVPHTRADYATWVMGLVAALLIVGIEIAILAVPERGPASRVNGQMSQQVP
jgi:hypothetical protein